MMDRAAPHGFKGGPLEMFVKGLTMNETEILPNFPFLDDDEDASNHEFDSLITVFIPNSLRANLIVILVFVGLPSVITWQALKRLFKIL